MFLGLPARDAETIAKARAELSATEWLKELCKQLGLEVGVVYPPVDRNLAPLYMARPKDRTQLGYHTLDWTKDWNSVIA